MRFLSDEELMIRCRQGETDKFNTLVKRRERGLIQYIDKLLHDYERAKELAQETFLRAFSARERYQPKAKFTTWLYRIALNLCRDEYRKMSRSPVVSLYETHSYEFSDEWEKETYELYESIPDTTIPSPEEALEQEEQQALLKAAIDSLAPKHRTVLIMRIYEELEYAEIAKRLGCSIGTVKSRMHYAMEALKSLCDKFLYSSAVQGKI